MFISLLLAIALLCVLFPVVGYAIALFVNRADKFHKN